MSFKIPLNKPYVPDAVEFAGYLERIRSSGWLTNFGPLSLELEQRLAEFLGVEHLLLVSNGTLAIQIALRTLDVTGPVLTTPFTFVASSSAPAWMGHEIHFADIDSATFNLDPTHARQQAATAAVGAILPVHTFGTLCDLEGFAALASELEVPLIYDACHAFGVRYENRSVLAYGNAAVLSLHATKVFHSVEGGAIAFRSRDHLEKARRLINFGIDITDQGRIKDVGINAKMSEFHAAVGLCMLPKIQAMLSRRAELEAGYRRQLEGWVSFQARSALQTCNGAYMPISLNDESALLRLQQHLTADGIQTRRYFYPSLNDLAVFGGVHERPNSQSVASRILCLPLFYGMTDAEVVCVCESVKSGLRTLT